MSRPGSKSGKSGLFMAGHELISPFGITLWSAVRRTWVPTWPICGKAIRIVVIRRGIPTEITLLVEGGSEI
jgi:hypothetical protein